MRCPRMQGLPKQTLLSIEMRERSACLFILSFTGNALL